MLVFLYGCREGGYVSVDVAFGVNAGFSLRLQGGRVCTSRCGIWGECWFFFTAAGREGMYQ